MNRSLHIADLFCGAGGTSTGAVGAAEALGYTVNLTAVNHWDVAVETHTQNHPKARHLCASLDSINPRSLFKPGELDILWGSPECMHHSTARGGKPIHDQSRATAWCLLRWADALLPSVILVENVPEFRTWGPLNSHGRPLASRKGETFHAWINALESLGYRVDHRVLCAADYGDPTTRRRLFVQAVRGRRQIRWPEPSHISPLLDEQPDLLRGKMPTWVPAKDIIDWTLPGRSIYDRERPIASKTLDRIWTGLNRFGLKPFNVPGQSENGLVQPFVIEIDHQSSKNGSRPISRPLSTITTEARHAVIEPFLVRMHGTSQPTPSKNRSGTVEAGPVKHYLAEPFLLHTAHGSNGSNGKNGDKRKAMSIQKPLPTVCGQRGDIALCEPFLLPQQSGGALRPVTEPVPTIATAGKHQVVQPFLISYYGTGQPLSVESPLDTVTTRERFGLVRPHLTVNGEQLQLDIRLRMLQPHELAAAQGFPRGYQFAGNKTQITKQIGNAVPVNLARAIVHAVLTTQ